jgi:GNAT superfamily N-acetyltransferase
MSNAEPSIRYTNSLDGVEAATLNGFFENWRRPLTPDEHLRVLAGSADVVLAIDDDAGRVVGFITALTDGALCAFIPLLEVLPEYRGRGIGGELFRRMLELLPDYPHVDVMCDAGLQGFYERFGMSRSAGMILRRRPAL